MKEWYQARFMSQKMMHPVLKGLIFLLAAGTYFYGWRVVALAFVNVLIAVGVEYLCETKLYKRKKISEAVFVTALLYTYTLPPALPFWMSALGIAFGVFFGKMVFGGFGKNVFNPAIVGRAFVYITFPQQMTIVWNQAAKFGEFPGGFATYLTPHIDQVSTATPMLLFKNGAQSEPFMNLMLGSVSGAVGESMKLFILIGGIYMIYKKVASWEIMAASVCGFSLLSLLFLAMGFGESVQNPLYGMLSGGFLLGTVFMATDPISAAKTRPGKWIFGLLIGAVTVIIRGFSLFSGGMMFAILIGNIFAPIVDYMINQKKARDKERKAGAA